MKNFTLISLLAIVVFSTTFAQPTLQWASVYNAGGNDQGNDLVVDGNGNIYVVGTSDGINFLSDYLTIKYNSNGDTLWTRRFNGNTNGIDEAYKIKIDPMGNVYVTGKSATTTTGYNIVTIKYNSSGVQQWVANFDAGNSGSNKDDIGLNMLVDIAGNVYVVGSSVKPGSSVSQGIVIKYNSSGVKQWHTHIGGGTHIAKLIEQNTFGNIIVPTGNGEFESYYNIYVINPANGVVLQIYNQDLDPVLGNSEDIVLDASGNIYLTSTGYNFCFTPNEVHIAKFSHVAPPQSPPSHSWDSWTFVSCGSSSLEGIQMKMDATLNMYVLSDFFNSVKHNFHLKKYNPNGGTNWALTQPSTTDDTPISLALGNLSDPATPDLYVTGNTSTGLIKTIKYENDSTLLWSKTYSCGNGIASAAKMVVDDCDNIYITGFSTCNGTFKDVRTLKYSAPAPTITPDGPIAFCQGGSVTLTASTANSYLWSNGSTTPSITVSASGMYSVTITNAIGCTTASSVVTVLVNPIPIVTVNSPTICAGQLATLTANGAATYQWNTGQTINPIIVGPNSSTTYTVTGTTANCTSAPASAQVMVNPLPPVTVNSPTICVGQSATLTANGAATYQWSTGQTINPIIVSPNSNTTYTVTGTSAAQCSSSATAQVFVNPIVPTSVAIVGPSVICLDQNATFSATPTNGGTTPTYQWFVNDNPVGNGPIYSTPTLANGDQVYCTMTSNATCPSQATTTSPTTIVTVLVLPNAQIVPGSTTTFCQGDSVTLTASPTGTAYSWNPGGATTESITVSTAGDYTVAVTAANSCSAVSAVTTLTVNPLPQTPMIFPSGPIIILCQGDSAILTSGFANSYSWNTGASTQSITVSAAGDYSVVITDINGCSAASNPTSVLCTVGASEAALPEGFIVFPNPSAGSFAVKFFLPGSKMVAQRVLNVLGQVVWVGVPVFAAGDYHCEIDLGIGVMPGIYLLETRLEGRVFWRKIEVI